MSASRVREIAALDPAVVERLRGRMRGRVIEPADPAYDEARSVYNAMIDKRPALIARCAGVGDVLACIELAHEHELLVAVRGGGHSVAGRSVCDGGLVIDLSPMDGIRVDPVRRTARAEGGVTWGAFDHETSAFGLATTGGVVSTTGIAGLTLGGGIGWLMRKHGLTCDNLLSVDLVTAEGRFVRASEDENPDLFWGVRGAGANFGIVTSFEYRLHPLRERVLAGLLLYPGERRRDVLRLYNEWAQAEPDELTSFLVFLNAPALPSLPPEHRGKPVVGLALAHSGPLEEAERAIRPLRERAEPIVDLIAPVPYPALQRMSDDDWRWGNRNYWKPEFLGDLSESLIDTILEHCDRFVPPTFEPRQGGPIAAQPINYCELGHLGGAVGRVGESETAFGHRDAPYLANITAVWTLEEETDRLVSWARDFSRALQPFSHGAGYVNYFVDEDEERLRAAYGAEKYERLVDLKTKYDPANFFRLNENIVPRAV